MARLREMMVVLLAMSALAACQNLAGAPGTEPVNCAMVGSSCSLDPPLADRRKN